MQNKQFDRIYPRAPHSHCHRDDTIPTPLTVTHPQDNHTLKEAQLDAAAERVLLTRFRAGEFDEHHPFRALDVAEGVVNSPAHRALAREAAAKSSVLLVNPPGKGGVRPRPSSPPPTSPLSSTLSSASHALRLSTDGFRNPSALPSAKL